MPRKTIANLNPSREAVAFVAHSPYKAPPDMGYNIEAEVTEDGRITVTNSRNGASKSYRVQP